MTIKGGEKMLQISRNVFTVPTSHIYFDDRTKKGRFEAKIAHYTHRTRPSRQLQKKQTIHLILQHDESIFLNQIPEEISEILFTHIIEQYKTYTISDVSIEQLRQFQRFYNENQTSKDKLNRTDFNKLLLLCEKEGLVLTKIENSLGETICYRVHIVDGHNVLLHYVVSAANLQLNIVEQANLLLCWENLKMFKNLGYKTYDFGGLDRDGQLLRCGHIFGGEEVTVFSGYIANSVPLKVFAKLKNWRKKVN